MTEEQQWPFPPSEGELLPCGIVIDREGDWYYQGSRMHRADIVTHLCQHLGRDEFSGLYIIQMGRQRCSLQVEDTPLVVTGVLHTEQREGDKPEQLLLAMKHLDRHESLDPESLWIGEQNVNFPTFHVYFEAYLVGLCSKCRLFFSQISRTNAISLALSLFPLHLLC